MEFDAHLLEAAKQVAAEHHGRDAQLKREELEIENRRAEIMAKREAERDAAQRLLNFSPSLGGVYQCPRCWIDHGQRSALAPIPGTDTEERFKCRNCHDEFSFPVL